MNTGTALKDISALLLILQMVDSKQQGVVVYVEFLKESHIILHLLNQSSLDVWTHTDALCTLSEV